MAVVWLSTGVRPVRILVAEDDQVTSQTICAMVRGLGHRPMPAFDAMQTLMLAMRAPHPDAILLDLNMPGGTGMGALEKLRASSKTAHIPVIVLSGTMDPEARRAALDAGATEFLGKPTTTQQLKATLEALADEA
jgi:CheY-like chemotaxis protein